MTLFQGIVLGVFIVSIVGGVILFGIVQNKEAGSSPAAVMWGTVPQDQVEALLNQVYGDEDKTKQKISYSYKSPETFDADFLDALASGLGPDMVLLPQQEIFKQAKRLYVIPPKTLPERTFKDTFAQEGELFLTPEGTVALPLSFDPLVMYWNRTLFTAAGLAKPPQYWDELVDMVPRLSQKDSSGNLKVAGVAMGEFGNVSYAKDILSALLLQAGTPIVGEADGAKRSLLDEKGSLTVSPADTAVTFFTQFANPVKTLYSWSRSFPDSIDNFAAGDVGILFAKASDVTKIQAKNPNLNFDVADFPEPRGDANGALTYADVYGIAVVKNSTNINGALSGAYLLTSSAVEQMYEDVSGLPPARRDLLGILPDDPYKSVFYRAALRSRGWFDPDAQATDKIFGTLVDTVVSGREGIGAAAKEADTELDALLDKALGQ